MLLPSILLLAAEVMPPPDPAPARAEAWTCKITAGNNAAIVMAEGRFEVMGNQLFGPSSDAVPLAWRMKIVRNTPGQLLAENETGPGRQWLVIDKRRLSITTYSFADHATHNGRCNPAI